MEIKETRAERYYERQPIFSKSVFLISVIFFLFGGAFADKSLLDEYWVAALILAMVSVLACIEIERREKTRWVEVVLLKYDGDQLVFEQRDGVQTRTVEVKLEKVKKITYGKKFICFEGAYPYSKLIGIQKSLRPHIGQLIESIRAARPDIHFESQ
ncbi:hypothetical protein EUZ85_11530 [Hahella sp. KA22]|uniref:hypothetical protein n=1 Tax=Hahella sp. KA22 TaxID=1628392 RepID=UPI000FDEFF6F|nr:hypothetical protein [Hahella sp. KA22]AZZ91327.1 hypothetical protein ENC22_08970 [Hahella sp. KA22]QAY54696.1 hypothetical protein EUZ85_11530 [Hahella sp. KA22]